MNTSQTIAIINTTYFFQSAIKGLCGKRDLCISLKLSDEGELGTLLRINGANVIFVSYSAQALFFFDKYHALFKGKRIVFVLDVLHLPTVRLLHSFGFFEVVLIGDDLGLYLRLLNSGDGGSFHSKTDRKKMLTKMERKVVLSLLSENKRNPVKMCALELGVSDKTITTHKKNITKKLCLPNFLFLVSHNTHLNLSEKGL
ncbi:LuxR C-terminal-related transcriptional regulator [Enterobacter bugandensis]|uniref:LuxR C-terminal-related transcriptional regulator n=1 Tax=Enterobacter bugandensis TaxID=881260 RepID=A0AA42PXF8_9ENTR|nr:LuxR C-terminal-related transcriptional regulator [Enterobacter bugandensis]MDH1321613.1 LuxR C-terminal-related transcriptional regulator [Enterobacter bugandensis]